MPIRDNDPRPAYQQLADELRQAIATGRYEVGDRLPSTRELSESHGIALMTVRAALGVLEDEKLIVARQGRGVFVERTPEPPDVGPASLATVRETLQETMKLLQGINDRLDRYEAAGRGGEAAAHGAGIEAAGGGEVAPAAGVERDAQDVGVDEELDPLDAAMEDLKAINATLDAADAATRARRPQIEIDPGPPPPEPDLGIDL